MSLSVCVLLVYVISSNNLFAILYSLSLSFILAFDIKKKNYMVDI